MELRDTVLFSLTSVCASENAVPHRVGGSITAAGAGRCIIGSAGWAEDGEVLAAAESMAPAAEGNGAAAGFLPSGLAVLTSNGVRLPALGGKSRVDESIDGRGPGALFIWFLEGGLSFGNREKAPPCGGPADMVIYSATDRMMRWCLPLKFLLLQNQRSGSIGRLASKVEI